MPQGQWVIFYSRRGLWARNSLINTCFMAL